MEEELGEERWFRCVSCDRAYPVLLDIPDLRVYPDPYIGFEQDRAKGLRVAKRFDELDFSGLVDYYYSITSVVPEKHARQFKRGLMAGVARARNSFEAWQTGSKRNGTNPPASLLDAGCGTAPLLVAAAPHCARAVGVDIAFRWLVVAQKRLSEHGLDIPLICACADAMPFHSEQFDLATADSLIEHLQDQPQAASELFRVLENGGYLYFSTPNRLSLGPDPHTGLWAGSWFPERLSAAYVRRSGGIPPQRQLLTSKSVRTLLSGAGFEPPTLFLPDVSAEQRQHFGRGVGLLIDAYQTAKRWPGVRQLLQLIGPFVQGFSRKPAAR